MVVHWNVTLASPETPFTCTQMKLARLLGLKTREQEPYDEPFIFEVPHEPGYTVDEYAEA